ncbi:MAG: response regulator [bacterium]|nr:response regulator [bacterium]
MTENNKITVLAVDDEELNLDLLRACFEETTIELLEAMSGAGMRELLETQEQLPDIILLDIMMPNEDGYEIAEKLRKDERYKHIPLIFVTAKNAPQDIAAAFEMGQCDDYIIKPFKRDDLILRVQTTLERKKRTIL